ncbi:MAG: ABC transporter ATP-binding protein [Bacilli bacterium]|nr:ABC transporter ATP-binding protein [Bacilli bacterium]
MEIILHGVSYRNKSKTILDKISLCIKDNKITGVIGDNKTLFLELLDAIAIPSSGDIYIDRRKVERDNLDYIRQIISLVRQNSLDNFFTTTVKEEMNFVTKMLHYNTEKINKKMIDSLKLVGLDESYIKRSLFTLSASERKLVQIAISLITNPKIIMFDEPFEELDNRNRKIILKLIRKLKVKYNKTIIIATNDTNILYENCDDLIIIKGMKVIAADNSDLIFKDIEFLKKNNIDVPNLVLFTHLAKNKKVRLMYHKDIKDLIKDVYKHV